MVIDEVLAHIRDKKFVFPYKTQKDQMLTEMLAAEISGIMPAERIVGGSRIRTYVKRGSQTIDIFMALIYAYVSLRFSTSQGFRNITGPNYGEVRTMPIPRKAVGVKHSIANSMMRRMGSARRTH
jgi:hypothetical protein